MQSESTIPDRFPDPIRESEFDPQSTAIQTRPTANRRRLMRDLVQIVVIVVIVFAGLRAFALPYRVDGSSMRPYLIDGERLFVSQTAYAHVDLSGIWNLLPGEDRDGSVDIYPFSEPERGDIIVLEPPAVSSEPYIKRVIGLPGERITFAHGLVFVNGEALTEDYIDGAITGCEHTPFCAVTVPPGRVFVLGDNRLNSTDSRVFGTIPYDHIVGKAIFSNWPFETLGPIDHPHYELTTPAPR